MAGCCFGGKGVTSLMLQFLKGNSCLLAFDSHPAFQTGEKLGLFFADFVQDFELSVSPARTQSRQIGCQNYGVNSVNFSPDVIANLSFTTKSDFNNENLLGAIFRPSGSFVSPFSGIRDYSFNTYLFFSQEQGYDLAKQILDSNSFSGVGVVSLGNCFLANGSFSFSAGNLPRTACSFLASNLVSEILSGNSMAIPAVNLEIGNASGAAEILLDPAQVARRETGNLSGILPTWQSLFRPTFENLQIPSQGLVSANVNSLELSFSIDRENVYGFGSDYVRERDVKFPIQASLSINGVVNDYISGNFPDLMVDESKYMVEIYNRDPQDAVLSGLSISELTGLSPYQHITKNRWLKFENCTLRESTNKVSPNQLMEYSASFDVEVTENGGFLFKQGEEESIDDMNLHSSDFHRIVSRDGYRPIHYPFLQYFEEDCSLTNLLSSDKQILMTPDNFIEGWMNPTCSTSYMISYSIAGGTWQLRKNGSIVQTLSTTSPSTVLNFSPIEIFSGDDVVLRCTSLPNGVSSILNIVINSNDIVSTYSSGGGIFPTIYSINFTDIMGGSVYSATPTYGFAP